MRWVGWYRTTDSAPWRRASEGESLSECARALDKATQGLRIRNRNYIMTGGGYPQTAQTEARR
jgi:hypothetical protein